MSIKLNFKHLRKLKRISQQNLAIRLGISQTYLNQLENNTYNIKYSPRLELLERLAQELGGCFLDIVECDGNCERCRHKQICFDDDQEEIHYFI